MHSLPTIDAHLHLWQRSRTPQDWIDPVSMPEIDRDFWLDDLERVLTNNGIESGVVVQANNSGQETIDLLSAQLPDRVGAIVGWVDLQADDVESAVGSLRGLPNGRYLSGIRHLAHVDPDPHWLTRASVSHGLSALEKAGLSFDLVVTPDQLTDCARVVSEHPGMVFVVDHLGKPSLRSGTLTGWEEGLGTLAEFPNVYAKVSGLTMEADWKHWTIDDLDRAVTKALEWFGPTRLMWGSDWPLVEVCGGYGDWLAAARMLLSRTSEAERQAVFSETARVVYRMRGLTDG